MLKCALGAVALILGGCTAVPPSSTPALPTPSLPSSTQPVDNQSEPAASPSPPPGPSDPAFEFGVIDQRYTTPTLDYKSDGTSLIWSSSAADGPAATSAADLWRYVPGGSEPERIFVNTHRDSTLDIVAGDGEGHFAFVERNQGVYGDSGWRLWYLAEAGGSPIQLDASDDASATVPFFAIDAGRVVWGAVHESGGGPRSQLLYYDPAAGDTVVLQEGDPNEIGFAFPSLDGDRVAYSAFVAPDRDPATQEFRIYELDLARPSGEPVRLDDGGDPAMPVLTDDYVVWKVAPDNAYGWGQLAITDQTTGEMWNVAPSAMHTDAELSFNYPSIGAGYVAAYDTNHNSLYLYDLASRRAVLVEDLGEERNEGERDAVLVRPHIQGALLAFIQGSDDLAQDLILRYAWVP